jgi:hypothetical protein
MQIQDTEKANTTSEAAKTRTPVSAQTAALRQVLLPMARLYSGVDIEPEDDARQSPTLTTNERAILTEAARKFAAEGDVLLHTWRQTGEFSFDKSKVQRDPKTGAWPEPSLSLVAELGASIEALRKGTLPLRQQQQIEERERARMELEMKRLQLEERRLEIMQDQIKRGVRRPLDPGLFYEIESTGTKIASLSAVPDIKAVKMTKEDMQAMTMIRSADLPIGESAATGDSIQDCLRVALCDLLLCFLDLICSNGTLDLTLFGGGSDEESEEGSNGRNAAERLFECLGTFLCTFLNCYVNRLCPQKQSECLPLVGRCDFAVEEVC